MRNTSHTGKRAKATSPSADTTSAATGTITSVAGAIASTTLLASNKSRKGMLFYNNSDAILYLAFASTVVSATNFSTLVLPHAPLFLMEGAGRIYTGIVKGIWASATGNVLVTE